MPQIPNEDISPRGEKNRISGNKRKNITDVAGLILNIHPMAKVKKMQRVLLGPKEEKSVWVLEEKLGSGLFPTLLYSFHQLIKFNRKEKIKSLFITGRLTGV